jgi:hypothetical protein
MRRVLWCAREYVSHVGERPTTHPGWRYRASHRESDRACERHRAALARSTCERIWHPPADLALCSSDGPAHRTVFIPLCVRSTHSPGDSASVAAFVERYYKKSYSRFALKPSLPETHVPSDYARRLRSLRRRLGLPQAQLATRIGAAGKAVIYQWESNKRHPLP